MVKRLVRFCRSPFLRSPQFCARPLLTLRKNRPRLLGPRGLGVGANNEVLHLATLTLPGAQNIYSNVRESANASRRWVDIPVLQRVA